MNGRHLTPDEKKALLKVVDACGFAETLRVIAQYVANEHPDVEVGTALRGEICGVAKKINAAWESLAQP